MQLAGVVINSTTNIMRANGREKIPDNMVYTLKIHMQNHMSSVVYEDTPCIMQRRPFCYLLRKVQRFQTLGRDGACVLGSPLPTAVVDTLDTLLLARR
jgi:hypothetical protein